MNINSDISKSITQEDKTNSMFKATILPVEQSFDWIIPTALILDIKPYHDVIKNEEGERNHDINLVVNSVVGKVTDDKAVEDKLTIIKAVRHSSDSEKQTSEEMTASKKLTKYEYEGKTIPVVSLFAEGKTPESLVILEGVNDEQRIGLLISDKLSHQTYKVSGIKDVEPSNYKGLNTEEKHRIDNHTVDLSTYILHVVQIKDRQYAVPHLQKLVEQS